MKVGNTSTMEPPSSGGLATEHTQLKGMFAVIAYHIDFIPSIKVQQQQMDGVQMAVTGSQVQGCVSSLAEGREGGREEHIASKSG